MTAADRAHAESPRVIAGHPTEEELAAVVAVFAELTAERAGARRIHEVPTRSRTSRDWSTSLRAPSWDGNYWERHDR